MFPTSISRLCNDKRPDHRKSKGSNRLAQVSDRGVQIIESLKEVIASLKSQNEVYRLEREQDKRQINALLSVIADLRKEIASLHEAIDARNNDIAKAENINKGLSRIISNKTEKQAPPEPSAKERKELETKRAEAVWRQSVRRLSRPVEITAQSEAPIRRTLHIRESFTLHPTLPVSICPPPRLSAALIRRVTPPHIWKAGGTAIKRVIWRRYSTVRLCISRTAACTVERHRQPHSLTLPMSPQQ